MPVTAKLSRRFYDQFGDETTNELVDWFNAVDATYQASLRELNEINFARFDAKMEQRIASAENGLNAKIDGGIASLRNTMEKGFAQQGEAMVAALAKLSEAMLDRIAASESRMLKWTIGLWTGTILTMVGLFMALLQLR